MIDKKTKYINNLQTKNIKINYNTLIVKFNMYNKQ